METTSRESKGSKVKIWRAERPKILTPKKQYKLQRQLQHEQFIQKKKTTKKIKVVKPENDDGNIEYKRKLTGLSDSRILHLITQMKWRLSEGNNRAIYLIGIDDDGTLYQMTDDEMAESIDTFKKITIAAECDIVGLHKITAEEDGIGGTYLKIEIEKRYNMCPEIRIALVGESGSGKSTLMSSLLYDNLDDGKGESRKLINKHLHEIESGLTSSIVYDYIGISTEGKFLNYRNSKSKDEIIKKSIKLVTFMDLPGKDKYLKTTLYGLLAYRPHHIFYVVDSADSVYKKDSYINTLNTTQIPWTLIITKLPLDKPYSISDIDFTEYVINSVKEPSLKQDYSMGSSDGSVKNYYIPTCNITGRGIDTLKHYIINDIKIKQYDDLSEKNESIDQQNDDVEFMINEVYDIKDVGTVVGGILLKGKIVSGSNLYLNRAGIPVRVRSIHRHQKPQKDLLCDTSASMMLEMDAKDIHNVDKHSWLYSNPEFKKCFVNSFSAKLFVQTNGEKIMDLMTMAKGVNMLYINNLIQPVKILSYSDEAKGNFDGRAHVNESCIIKFDNEDNYGIIRTNVLQSTHFYIKTNSNDVLYGLVSS
jgi:GTPase